MATKIFLGIGSIVLFSVMHLFIITVALSLFIHYKNITIWSYAFLIPVPFYIYGSKVYEEIYRNILIGTKMGNEMAFVILVTVLYILAIIAISLYMSLRINIIFP